MGCLRPSWNTVHRASSHTPWRRQNSAANFLYAHSGCGSPPETEQCENAVGTVKRTAFTRFPCDRESYPTLRTTQRCRNTAPRIVWGNLNKPTYVQGIERGKGRMRMRSLEFFILILRAVSSSGAGARSLIRRPQAPRQRWEHKLGSSRVIRKSSSVSTWLLTGFQRPSGAWKILQQHAGAHGCSVNVGRTRAAPWVSCAWAKGNRPLLLRAPVLTEQGCDERTEHCRARYGRWLSPFLFYFFSWKGFHSFRKRHLNILIPRRRNEKIEKYFLCNAKWKACMHNSRIYNSKAQIRKEKLKWHVLGMKLKVVVPPPNSDILLLL